MYQKTWRKITAIFGKKRVNAWVFLGAILIALIFCTVFKSYMDPLNLDSAVNMQFSRGTEFVTVSVINTRDYKATTKPQKLESGLPTICTSTKMSDFCNITGDIRVHGNTSSIYFTTTSQQNTEPQNRTFGIKLYARKIDRNVMGKTREYKLELATSQQQVPECTVKYTVPGIVFSAAGYTGNYYHDISDVMIPLYLTSMQFNGQVQFVAELKPTRWVDKYIDMLSALSNYEIINLTHDDEIRCFKHAIVGLNSHADFGVDPKMAPLGLTLRNFTQFVGRAYSLQRHTVTFNKSKQPRLLIIARKNTRAFLNEEEIAKEARNLGYDVEIIDARRNITEFSKIVNSFDVMVGIHGAGLTNMIFLPENAILIQVVPLELEGIAETFYERPARNMNLRYLEYKITKNESSLIEQYPSDDRVFVDPKSIRKEGWLEFKRVYMDNQNVRVDVIRFRSVLLEALEMLRS